LPAPAIQRRTLVRTAVVLGTIAPIAGCTWIEVLLAPKASPWPLWTRHSDTSTKKIDHDVWTNLLAAYVVRGKDGINRVRYHDISNGDAVELSEYLDYLTSLSISAFSRAEQQAYWINLYNARTIRLVLEHYPVVSMMDIDISPGLLSFGPWDKKLVSVEGVDLSLNDIEHRILRPGWSDNRVHYALNCAALGCPNLSPIAFTQDNTEALLAKGAWSYINHPRGVAVAVDKVIASKIYAWFKEDFGNRDHSVINHFREYAEPDLRKSLSKALEISSYTYDWALNDTAGAEA
jgi:hypothetical protein